MSNKSNLIGVKGWLLFLVFQMMILTPLSIFIFGYSSFHVEELVNTQLKGIQEWQDLKNSILFATIIFSCVSIYGGYKLYSGKRNDDVAKAAWSLWLSSLGFVFVSAFIIRYHFDFIDMGDYLIKGLISGSIHASIWTAYLHKSVRVKNTYSGKEIISPFSPEIKKQVSVTVDRNDEPKIRAHFDSVPVQAKERLSKERSMLQKTIHINEDAIYESIADELESGSINKGLWIKLFAKYDGDEVKIKAEYIRQRFSKLQKDAIQSETNKHQATLQSDVQVISRENDDCEPQSDNGDSNGGNDNKLKSLISDYKNNIDYDKAVQIAQVLGYYVSSTVKIGSRCISVKSPYGQVFYFNNELEFEKYVLNSLC